MDRTTAPSTDFSRPQPAVRAAVATLHAITDELDAMSASHALSPLAHYQLSQLGVQAWLAGQRGHQLLATLSRGDSDDADCVDTAGALAADPALADTDEASLTRLHVAVLKIHRTLSELIGITIAAPVGVAGIDPLADIDGSRMLLVFVHELGTLCLDLASHVR